MIPYIPLIRGGMEHPTKAERLESLLEFASAGELRKSIQKAFFSYLLEQEDKGLDLEYKKVVQNHYFLMEFLDELEAEYKANSAG